VEGDRQAVHDQRAEQPSIALAHAAGFRDVGVHEKHGQLDGRWLDVLVVERLLDAP
jgi:L-amino acid N-acyltransferase YncA